jgi:hypothetical protein
MWELKTDCKLTQCSLGKLACCGSDCISCYHYHVCLEDISDNTKNFDYINISIHKCLFLRKVYVP